MTKKTLELAKRIEEEIRYLKGLPAKVSSGTTSIKIINSRGIYLCPLSEEMYREFFVIVNSRLEALEDRLRNL